MNIVIIGAGGVGGHFGALLLRARHHVVFQARGSHLEAMCRSGLRIQTPTEDFTVRVEATDDASQVNGAELVVLAVKSYSLGDVAPSLRALSTGGAAVLPLLNGIDIVDRCVALGVPRSAMLGGLARVSTVKAAPGVIVQDEPDQKIELGELDGGISERVKHIAQAFESAGIAAEASGDINLALWRKYVSLASRASLCAMSGGTMNAVRARPYGLELFRRAVREAGAVARACGIPVTPAIENDICERDSLRASDSKPSFVADLERGGRTEIDTLSGALSRLGRRHGVPTPVHDVATLLYSHTGAEGGGIWNAGAS